MSRSEIAARVLALASVAIAIDVTVSACQLGDGSCLRLSDCETGWQCVEGTCRTDEVPAPPPDADAAPGADARTEPPRVFVATDAAADAADEDASSIDGGPTDAASDR